MPLFLLLNSLSCDMCHKYTVHIWIWRIFWLKSRIPTFGYVRIILVFTVSLHFFFIVKNLSNKKYDKYFTIDYSWNFFLTFKLYYIFICILYYMLYVLYYMLYVYLLIYFNYNENHNFIYSKIIFVIYTIIKINCELYFNIRQKKFLLFQ